MASPSAVTNLLSPTEHQKQLRRAVVASTVGTAIEWYDFFLYSTVTGLVFAKLFFPHSDPWVGTLEAFGIYAVGFVARPVGAVIFGHFGDRIGRKSTLIVTLLLMGLATFAVALVPSYASIGLWGAVVLTVLRFIQGVGVGGEWGGSVLLSMEWARSNQSRGLIASWPQFGVPVACSSQIWRCLPLAKCLATNFPGVGVAGAIRFEPLPCCGRALHPPWNSRDTGLLSIADREQDRVRPDYGSDQELSARNRLVSGCAHG
jgi:MFS family permease